MANGNLKPWPKFKSRRRSIDWRRVGDWAGGFGLGLLVGLVGAFMLMAQLGQWGAK